MGQPVSWPGLRTLLTAVLLGWAVCATVAGLHWMRSYRQALELSRPQPPEKTPHQRGAETRKRRTVEAMRERRMAMELAIKEARA